jgi:hypothetical protein
MTVQQLPIHADTFAVVQMNDQLTYRDTGDRRRCVRVVQVRPPCPGAVQGRIVVNELEAGGAQCVEMLPSRLGIYFAPIDTDTLGPMQEGSRGFVFVNQGWRPARCLGIVGGAALVHYLMPEGREFLIEVDSCLPLNHRSAWWHVDGRPKWQSRRTISRNKVPSRWRAALARFDGVLGAEGGAA